MDDEAAIKITLIIVIGIILFGACLTFGVGWNQVTAQTQRQEQTDRTQQALASAAVEKTAFHTCAVIPDAKRAACITDVMNQQLKMNAFNECVHLWNTTNENFNELYSCVAKVFRY